MVTGTNKRKGQAQTNEQEGAGELPMSVRTLRWKENIVERCKHSPTMPGNDSYIYFSSVLAGRGRASRRPSSIVWASGPSPYAGIHVRGGWCGGHYRHGEQRRGLLDAARHGSLPTTEVHGSCATLAQASRQSLRDSTHARMAGAWRRRAAPMRDTCRTGSR
jgi:hypothetical protein